MPDKPFLPHRELTVDSGGILLAVRDYGGEGTPLVLLHGSGGTLADWDDVVPLLTPSFRVAVYDAPAHGQSQAPLGALQVTRFLDAVDDVVAALGLERPLLVGHSMGGGVVQLYASQRSGCRAVVSVDGAYIREASDPPPTFAGEEEIRAVGYGSTVTVEELEQQWHALPPGPARASCRRAHLRRPDGLFERQPSAEFVLAFTRLVTALEPRLTMDDLYASIGCPVLLVCGERGWIQGKPLTLELRSRVDALPARFPHVELAWLDCGHMIPWERPRELAALITAFAGRPATIDS